jgi:hypothetical protein
LARLLAISTRKTAKLWRNIAICFSLSAAGRLENTRLSEQRAESEKWRKAQSDAGKKGAESRWKKHSDPIGDPIGDSNATPMTNHSSASASAVQQHPPTPQPGDCEGENLEQQQQQPQSSQTALREAEAVAVAEVAAWNEDFPATTKGLRDEIQDQNAYLRLQRDEGKTAADFEAYRAYLLRSESVPRYWQRPRDLVRPTKGGTGAELWALIEQKIEQETKPDPVATPTQVPPVLYRPAWEQA